ncbi:MAG: hypothetical protein QM788_15075 [Roseateles sp.]|uniref:hypothetical protein n=1 Tax=Roseateles sp. TaxID=1971397 RepID=UPI0039EAD0E3
MSAARLAANFRTSKSTAHRWIAADRAPVAVLLALWLSAPSFGWRTARAEVIEAENLAALHAGHARALGDELERLRRELARVLAAGDFGSANAPTWRETAGELMAARRTSLRR